VDTGGGDARSAASVALQQWPSSSEAEPGGEPVTQSEDRPVLTGLVALVGVAVVVGLLAGVGAIVGSHVLGVTGDDGGGAEAEGEASLYLPDPVKTKDSGGPAVTLAATPTDEASEESSATEEPSIEKPKDEITLSAGSTTVGGENLYLSGVYPGGEGAILDIEYKVNDQPWREFNLDVNVSGQQFATYVYTSNTGTIKWRVWDKSKDKRSNAVTVKHTG
jgi:hypothetical protein